MPTTLQPRTAFWGLALASVAVQLPLWDRGLSLYDEGSILAIADALAAGESLYRDRVTQLGPFTYELMGWLFRFVSDDFWVGRFVQAAAFSGCVLLVFSMLRTLVGTGWALAAGLATLGVKTLAFPYWTAINYAPVGLFWCQASAVALVGFARAETRRERWLVWSGLGIGLAFVTKQNLGGLLGVASALVVLADWAVRAQPMPLLVRRAFVLTGCSLAPIAAVVAAYALHGTLGDLVQWTVVGLADMATPYQLPFPGFEVWALARESLPQIAFTYFPAPMLLWAWHGGPDITSTGVALTLELFVKPRVLHAAGARRRHRVLARGPAAHRFACCLLAPGSGAGARCRLLRQRAGARPHRLDPPHEHLPGAPPLVRCGPGGGGPAASRPRASWRGVSRRCGAPGRSRWRLPSSPCTRCRCRPRVAR